MRKSVWVIDDDQIYQMIIKKLIKRSEVFGEQAYYKCTHQVFEDLENSRVFLPDVILLDINMPFMDGWQFIQKLKSLYPDHIQRTEIYIVSSSIAYSDKERAESIPEICSFLSKPVSVETLKKIGEHIKEKNPV
ncbi:response regulator [Christiangramia sabulilitoris]|uniref:Response regulator n=1 Tax=Christiangramia sabulilitoris TaxID=2583991 RepID=A0A550HZU4_9FLAO|nr:response regulator [Christiangramia sabulilitoris]TRO64257.1 response regulator [Christiangramia sabulilitoris]